MFPGNVFLYRFDWCAKGIVLLHFLTLCVEIDMKVTYDYLLVTDAPSKLCLQFIYYAQCKKK